MTIPADAQSRNANQLRARFAAEVLRRKPSSVLDVGCGRGALLDTCRDAKVAASGIEADPACREELTARGHALLGNLEACASASFDWVTMRHVPHHLPEPLETFAEAFRVARSGIIVAEPWFDRSNASQAVAEDIDNWLKREDRRRGKFHARNFDLDGLIDLVPKDERLDTQWEHHTELSPRLITDIESEAQPHLAQLAPDSEEAREFAELLTRARRDGISCNGSMMVTFKRRTPHGP